MRLYLMPLILSLATVQAQEPPPLPEKLKLLQTNYEAAIARVTAPLTKTYEKELERLRSEFTRAGDLQSALAAETLMKKVATPEASGAPVALGDIPLSKMSADQFKGWLKGVTISEQSEFMNVYEYDGTKFTSMKQGSRTPRAHENVMIEAGKIFVPFTSTNATIVIDPSMKKAVVTYSTGGRHEARITPKGKD